MQNQSETLDILEERSVPIYFCEALYINVNHIYILLLGH